MAQTAACADIYYLNTGTLQDAFQFGTTGDTSWNFTNKTFTMRVKAAKTDTVALLTLTSAGGTIVVDDVTQRVLHLNVTAAVVNAALPAGEYIYELDMTDTVPTPNVVTPLLQGKLFVKQGT